jgi:hypothetical protein
MLVAEQSPGGAAMKKTGVLVILLVLGSDALSADDRPGPKSPRVFQFNGARIAEVRRRVEQGDRQLVRALAGLRSRADEALRTPLLSVADKPQVPPIGDKHDYLSIAPYWWPDPSKPDGKPYIRKDGQTNPDRANYDRPKIGRLCEAVPALALAHALTGNEAYATHASRLLRTWFLAPATRMNPNLNFGQFIPGITDGRAAGVIETRGLIGVVDAVGLLEGSGSWTAQNTEDMRAWFRSYLDWLQTSPIGQEESRARNNHGTWYDAQVASFALFVGDERLARTVLARSKARIATQIEPDGRQPLELSRTKALGYSVMNLEGLTTLAALGDRVGVALWHERSPDGRSIRTALDWMIPFATGVRHWPYQQIVEMRPIGLLIPLRRAAIAFHDPAYEQAIAKLIATSGEPDETLELLYPPQ